MKTYPNGVRVGYVPDHKKRAKQDGVNLAWFPASWTTKDIKHAGEHVANLKGNKHMRDRVIVFGNWKGVRVGVIRTHGQIGTLFPDSNQQFKKRGNK